MADDACPVHRHRLAMQLIPVAPPRMLTETRLVDTAVLYGQSVYATVAGFADQLSAMPSVHVGWAVLIAFVVIADGRSPGAGWSCSTPR